MSKKKISIILGVICLILTFAIAAQIKTVKNSIVSTDATFNDGELKDEVLKWKEKYDNSSSELEKSEKELEKQRTKATEKVESSSEKEKELKTGNTVLGLTDVKGEGIEITLKDNKDVTSDTTLNDISYYVIHDIDLMSIVNELKNAGAEAISINDQRIIQTTAITCAGNVAQINGEKVGAPFIIKAIGNQTILYEALSRPGGYIENLNSWVVTGMKKQNNIEITKYNGVIDYKYLKNSK